MGNRIGKEMLSKLQEIMHSKPNLISLCGIADDATEVDLSGLGMDADDAIILASELPGKRAISSLDLSSNRIGGYYEYYHDDGSGYGSYTATPEGPKVIADAIRDMGAMSSFTFSGDYSNEPVAMETSMTEVHFAGKGLGESGAIMVAAFLPKCT
jgi:hypothetical protein